MKAKNRATGKEYSVNNAAAADKLKTNPLTKDLYDFSEPKEPKEVTDQKNNNTDGGDNSGDTDSGADGGEQTTTATTTRGSNRGRAASKGANK